jgi:hypothetical protein
LAEAAPNKSAHWRISLAVNSSDSVPLHPPTE